MASLAACGLGLLVCGCQAFNPSFLALFPSSNQASFQTLPNPPGHVVVAFANQAEMDERLIAYLRALIPGLTNAEASQLRPRVRMRVRITYIDGTFLTVEFIDGSRVVDPRFASQAVPDLNQNDLNNAVALCDVASVQVEPGSNIEVFIPVEILQFQLVETTTPGGGVDPEFEQRGALPPQFRPLEVDTVDEDGNVVLLQNIGVRDVPSPVPNVICGSIVVITVSGVLTVPFLEGVSAAPSYDIDDEVTEAGIGGRYEFIVTVQ
jgi:hypothetical protein